MANKGRLGGEVKMLVSEQEKSLMDEGAEAILRCLEQRGGEGKHAGTRLCRSASIGFCRAPLEATGVLDLIL